MLYEPVCGDFCGLLQCAGLFEQMGGTGNQREFLSAVQQRIRLLVQFDHTIVRATDDQQGGCSNAAQCCFSGKVGASTARYYCRNLVAHIRSSLQCGGGSGAGAKIAQARVLGFGV